MDSPIATFVGGLNGRWRIDSISAPVGSTLREAPRLDIVAGQLAEPPVGSAWLLRGAASNLRYTSRSERAGLAAAQAPLGRAEATRAALIPIRKSGDWWALAQDERRAIFEEQSAHIAVGQRYLPAIARQLRHCRDLGEPFDFLTWFEYAPESEPAFEELLAALRGSAEWRFVDREVDIRLSLDAR